MSGRPALILFGGSLDSVTALAWAFRERLVVRGTLSFTYGQRHAREVGAAVAVASHYSAPHPTIVLAPDRPRRAPGDGGVDLRVGPQPDPDLLRCGPHAARRRHAPDQQPGRHGQGELPRLLRAVPGRIRADAAARDRARRHYRPAAHRRRQAGDCAARHRARRAGPPHLDVPPWRHVRCLPDPRSRVPVCRRHRSDTPTPRRSTGQAARRSGRPGDVYPNL